MLRRKLPVISFLLVFCVTTAVAQDNKTNGGKSAMGFIEGIQMSLSAIRPQQPEVKDTSRSMRAAIKANLRQSLNVAIETFMPFQFKYAILLNESVEKLTNIILYKTIDDWYGTRYRFGGTSERGIDCSAFMQVLASYAFGWMLPRTAREQYACMMRITKEQLKEGDFVFFNTRGGVSHVGMYLQNNKFVHSSSSQGVSIGDLSDSYWSNRFIGAGRASQNLPQAVSFPAF